WLFGEHFTDSPAKLAVAVVAFAAMAAGVIMLTRTAPQDLTPSQPARPASPEPAPQGHLRADPADRNAMPALLLGLHREQGLAEKRGVYLDAKTGARGGRTAAV